MQSVPDNSSDCCIVSNVSYLPVPTISRLERVCWPMRREPSTAGFDGTAVLIMKPIVSSATADERDDLQAIAIRHLLLGMPRPWHDLLIQLDCHTARRQL